MRVRQPWPSAAAEEARTAPMLRRGATARLRPPAQPARLKATQKNRHPYDLSLTDASLFSGPAHSWVCVRQYCAKIDEAARNRMELIVSELAERNGATGATESRKPNRMGTADERLQGTSRSDCKV